MAEPDQTTNTATPADLLCGEDLFGCRLLIGGVAIDLRSGLEEQLVIDSDPGAVG